MTALTWIAMTLAGGIGAALRLVVDGLVTARWRREFPAGTLIVNISGTLALGFLAAIALPHDLSLIVTTGLCGAYTTFSTWMLQTYEIATGRQRIVATATIVIPLIAGFAAGAAGWWLGSLIA